jgi:hypothetical protein
VKHFVFLDNGLTDRAVEMLCGQNDVTILQTDAPYNKYENTVKRYLAEKFSAGPGIFVSEKYGKWVNDHPLERLEFRSHD